MESMFLFKILAVFNIVVLLTILFFPPYQGKKLLWYSSVILWVMQLLCHFSHAGLYSLSGIVPTCTIAAIILGLCQCITLHYDSSSKRPFFTALLLLSLVLASLVPDEAFHDSFMMTYIFAVLFFLSRPFSLGFTLFSLAGMADILTTKSNTGNNSRMSKTSKDAAFMASIIFLGGEIIGCYWGFLGWGTTWRWSGNFQFSAMLFVLFMVSLHIPATLFRTKRGHDIFFSLPLLCIALCIVLAKVIS
ncbi:MAG: hypothetical protein COA36_03185 [Desulfotalea sp.]|nr:MAG: hypothetical protein COA36_03185 [Desulfotalea sp.]